MTTPQEDPVARSARREAALAFIAWAVAMTYTVGYCYLYGYGRDVETLRFVLWFPDWVFWGIIVPWGVCIVLSVVFAFGIMSDDSLGDDLEDGSELPGANDGVNHA